MEPHLNLTVESVNKDKGRSFSSILLASVVCDSLWSNSSPSNIVRPIYLSIAGSDNELRPFVANLKVGSKIYISNRYGNQERFKLEIMRSVDYQFSWQKIKDFSVVTIFQPELFKIDPGIVENDKISFCILPTNDMLVEPNPDIIYYLTSKGYNEKDSIFAAKIAPIFIAYLDRRTRCPLILDERFYPLLFLKCLNNDVPIVGRKTSNNMGYSRKAYIEYGLDNVNLNDGVVMLSSNDLFEEVLSKTVKEFVNG